MLVVVGEGLLNLGEFGFDPRVFFIAVGMKLGKGPQALLLVPMVDEPTWAFGEQENECDEKDRWNDLDAKRDWHTSGPKLAR